MTAYEALAQAHDEIKKISYRLEIGDEWNTLREMLSRGFDDCDGHATGCVQRAWDLAPTPKPRLALILGEVREGRHAWVEMVTPEDGALWADPTPGWPSAIEPPSWWTDHRMLYRLVYDGDMRDFPTVEEATEA